MAIGTTVKVGFDASAVRAGMGGLKGLFSGAMRGMRQVGIGAARQIGAGMTDLLGRVLMAIPEGVKETMDWAGDLNDMSQQTGVSIDRLVLLQEALRLSGAEAADTSRMISTLAVNIGEAMRETGPAQDALRKLGFKMTEFKGIGIDEAFEKIGRRAGEMSWGMGELETTMADLFGAKMGYKLIRFFRDFDGGMEKARLNVGDFAGRIKESAEGYDDMGDALGRFSMRWKELISVGLDEVVGLFGKDWIDQAFDWASPEKVRAGISALKAGFTEFVGWVQGGGFKTIFQDIGRMIGDGIMESMKSMNPFGSSGGIWKLFSGNQSSSSGGDLSQLITQGVEQTTYLRKISEKKGGWA